MSQAITLQLPPLEWCPLIGPGHGMDCVLCEGMLVLPYRLVLGPPAATTSARAAFRALVEQVQAFTPVGGKEYRKGWLAACERLLEQLDAAGVPADQVARATEDLCRG